MSRKNLPNLWTVIRKGGRVGDTIVYITDARKDAREKRNNESNCVVRGYEHVPSYYWSSSRLWVVVHKNEGGDSIVCIANTRKEAREKRGNRPNCVVRKYVPKIY